MGLLKGIRKEQKERLPSFLVSNCLFKSMCCICPYIGTDAAAAAAVGSLCLIKSMCCCMCAYIGSDVPYQQVFETAGSKVSEATHGIGLTNWQEQLLRASDHRTVANGVLN